jgi:hypothetical protein
MSTAGRSEFTRLIATGHGHLCCALIHLHRACADLQEAGAPVAFSQQLTRITADLAPLIPSYQEFEPAMRPFRSPPDAGGKR